MTPPETAEELLPERLSYRSLHRAAADCTACPLYRNATQTVFGEGKVRSDVMVVGEQPGDQEDRQGHPFVGRAGRVLSDGRVTKERGQRLDSSWAPIVVATMRPSSVLRAGDDPARGDGRLRRRPPGRRQGARPLIDPECVRES